jgi:hypothetical protein
MDWLNQENIYIYIYPAPVATLPIIHCQRIVIAHPTLNISSHKRLLCMYVCTFMMHAALHPGKRLSNPRTNSKLLARQTSRHIH